MSLATIASEARIRQLHLRVADLEGAVAFYRDVLGLPVTSYGPALGMQIAFLGSGAAHNQGLLMTWQGADGRRLELRYANQQALAAVVRRVLLHGWPIDAAQDHGGSVSLYLRDPDQNRVELYYERPQAAWFDEHGHLLVKAEPFDPEMLLCEELPLCQ